MTVTTVRKGSRMTSDGARACSGPTLHVSSSRQVLHPGYIQCWQADRLIPLIVTGTEAWGPGRPLLTSPLID